MSFTNSTSSATPPKSEIRVMYNYEREFERFYDITVEIRVDVNSFFEVTNSIFHVHKNK